MSVDPAGAPASPKTIWKYSLDDTRDCLLSMKRGAKVLSVQYQGAKLVLWALVDPAGRSDDTELRSFRIVGTGWTIPEPHRLTHLSTVQDQQGFVWHIFEEDAPHA